MSSSHGKSSHDQPVTALNGAPPRSSAGGLLALETGVSVNSGCVPAGVGVGVLDGIAVSVAVGCGVADAGLVAVGSGVDETSGVSVGSAVAASTGAVTSGVITNAGAVALND